MGIEPWARAVRQLGDVDGDEARLGAGTARFRDRVECARTSVCQRLRHRRRSVRAVAVHAAMFGAGLLLRTVINLRTQDLGYERDVLLIPIEAERPGRPPEAASALMEDLRQRIATIPGAQAAGVFGSALLDYRADWVDGSERLRTDRGEAAAGTKWTFAFAGPGFFDAVGMVNIGSLGFMAS
jgi:hypothetical protein